VVTALVLGAAALVVGALALAGVWRGGGGEATAGHAPDAKGRPPVVVLILDEFPTDDLLRPDGKIDARRFPNFARLASISTWFPNAFTVYDSTFKAVPAILDARLPERLTNPDVRSHQPSVYHLMHRLGYEIHKVESATAVCPPRICKGSRPRRPSVLDRLKGGGRPARLHKWIGAIRQRERPGFYLHHSLLPHEPWIYLPSGVPNRPYGEDPIEGINSKASFADTDLSQHNHMRHLLQVGYTDHELGRLLARLRRTGLLKRALVVVVADHGYAYDIGVPSRRFVSDSNVDEVAPVPLFIKAPGQMRGRVDDSMVRNVDVVPTIGDMLGRSIWWPHDGESVFSPASKARDELVITTRDFSREIRIGADELAERRAANRARWARLFGTSAYSERAFGDPWASVYRVGPNKQLLGRRLPQLDLGGSVATTLHAARAGRSGSRVRARIANAGLLDQVTPGAPIRPTRVTGRLENGSADETRELALVVNGRIRSVGRSFHLGRRPTEYFSFVFPERALRRGRNHVELLEVVDGGRSFVPLGGNHARPSPPSSP
jgi:Sulfatase